METKSIKILLLIVLVSCENKNNLQIKSNQNLNTHLNGKQVYSQNCLSCHARSCKPTISDMALNYDSVKLKLIFIQISKDTIHSPNFKILKKNDKDSLIKYITHDYKPIIGSIP